MVMLSLPCPLPLIYIFSLVFSPSIVLGNFLSCNIHFAVDSTLFNRYENDEDKVKEVASNLVSGVNSLYHSTLFTGEYSHFFFRLTNIDVLYDFCNHCNQTQMEFLQQFSKFNYSNSCLAILLTYRDFPEGLAGLAWRGTVCSETLNTGFITLLNNNAESTLADAVITLAHEIGHIFGATHDESTECSDRRPDYIMSEVGTSHHQPIFSSCSLSAMRSKLGEHGENKQCFQPTLYREDQAPGFCGNGVVEGDEQCDCGMDYWNCDDPCCLAGHVSPSDRYWNASARPCQRNSKQTCLDRFSTFFTFGMVCPFLFLTAVFCLTCGLLTWDWKKNRRFFPHHSSNRNSETQPSCVNNPIIKNQTKPKNKNGAEGENGAKPFWRRNQKFLKTEQIEPKNINSIKLKPIQRNSAPARYLPRSPPSPCRPNSPPPPPPSRPGSTQTKLRASSPASAAPFKLKSISSSVSSPTRLKGNEYSSRNLSNQKSKQWRTVETGKDGELETFLSRDKRPSSAIQIRSGSNSPGVREYNPQPLRRAPKPFIVPKSSSLTNQASQPRSKLKTLQSQQSSPIVDQKTFQDSGKGIDTNSPPFPRKLPKWPPIKDDISEDTRKYRSVPSNSSTTSNILKTHFNERNSSVAKETLKMKTTNSIYDPTPCRPAPRPPL